MSRRTATPTGVQDTLAKMLCKVEPLLAAWHKSEMARMMVRFHAAVLGAENAGGYLLRERSRIRRRPTVWEFIPDTHRCNDDIGTGDSAGTVYLCPVLKKRR